MSESATANEDHAGSHPFLYHYTSEAGLRGIIESNSLWATYFADLNDSQEIHELRGPLIDELTDVFVPMIKSVRKRGLRHSMFVSKSGGNIRTARQLAMDWVDALYSSTFKTDPAQRQGLCCITSFCSHAQDQAYERENGLLSQWRGYGGAGGYCLVFDTAKLQEMIKVERGAYFLLHLGLRPALYFTEGVALGPQFSSLFDESRRIVGGLIERQDKVDAGQVFAPFVVAATSTKHRGFFEEREVRLVTIAATKVADDAIKHMSAYQKMSLKSEFTSQLPDGRVRHHISLFGKKFAPLPIRQVLVGPSRHQSKNAELAREVVGKKIQVKKSATPFIG